MNKQSQEEFWQKRAEKYNNLDWVNEPEYIKSLIKSADFKEDDLVLDVGTGTGVIAQSISPLVKQIIGIDISKNMLSNIKDKENINFIKRDIREPIFCENTFNKITARMVFHHITENTQQAMNECYRVLKNGGKMFLMEGVPPNDKVKQDYIDIFKLKEDRLTFLEEDLINMMKNSGFKKIKVITYIMKEFSVKNWLENGMISQESQNKIFEMHVTASKVFKEAYNMKIVNGDCLIDVKNVIVIGEKI